MSQTGVLRAKVLGLGATECSKFLRLRWADGKCKISPRVTLGGYDSYGKTQQEHSRTDQALNTLLITPKRVPSARINVPGFRRMEEELVVQIEDAFGLQVVLHSAHVLRQSPATASSSIFSVHRDDEEYPSIHISASVKLTSDSPGDDSSKMVVAGAPFKFEYGLLSGAAAIFFASIPHYSEPPTSEREHLKMVYFFSLVKNIYIN